jgi:sphingomyelin phosphodiesterase 2
LSDHFAVEATIEREIPREDPEEENTPFLPIQKHIEHSLPSMPSATRPRGTALISKEPALAAEIYNQILTIIAAYVLRERFQRHARLIHFLVSLFISIGCLVTIWWSPHNFISFILCLVSTLCFAAGVIDGLIGGFFVSSELRALKEFEWEVRNARRTALGLGLDIEEDLGSPASRNWLA